MQVVEAHGARIPLIGLGTWNLRGRTCIRMVEQALRLGYRHVDTARCTATRREVGEGLRASGRARGQVFVTTKVWPSHFAPRELEQCGQGEPGASCACRRSIFCCCTGRTRNIPLADTLGALGKVKQAGLARHIGFRISPSR